MAVTPSCPHQMRYTGIPELTCVEDIDYLRNALMVTKDDATADARFTKLIDESSVPHYEVADCTN